MVLGESTINISNANHRSYDIQKIDSCKYFNEFTAFYKELKNSRIDPNTTLEYKSNRYPENLSCQDRDSRITSKTQKKINVSFKQ